MYECMLAVMLAVQWQSGSCTSHITKMEQMEPAAACIHRAEAVRWIAFLRALCIHAHEWR